MMLPKQPASSSPGALRFAVFPTPRPAVMVVSHERSGTHFLMNAIARACGYTSDPWVDLDWHSLLINYFSPENIAKTLRRLTDQHVASIIKSHHAIEFFDPILDDVLKSRRRRPATRT